MKANVASLPLDGGGNFARLLQKCRSLFEFRRSPQATKSESSGCLIGKSGWIQELSKIPEVVKFALIYMVIYSSIYQLR